MNRRSFLRQSTSCSAHIFALSYFGSGLGKDLFAAEKGRKIVTQEPWGRLEELNEGVWALISTPFETKNFTTVCNGGLIAGKTGVLAIEAMMQPAGAKWLAEQAKALTGRRPTDVVATHFHGDHVNGHPGFTLDGHSPNIWLTDTTKEAAEKNFARSQNPLPKFAQVRALDAKKPSVIDLGDRIVRVVPRLGHTNSDVTIEISDPKIVWTGDLFFNRMFPNYGDAKPDLLNQYAQELSTLSQNTLIVPGHGPIADQAAVQAYRDFLSVIEEAAGKTHQAGKTAEAGAGEFKLPKSMDEWMIWSPDNMKRAFAAWYRVLDAK